jgi:hypothetical protein
MYVVLLPVIPLSNDILAALSRNIKYQYSRQIVSAFWQDYDDAVITAAPNSSISCWNIFGEGIDAAGSCDLTTGIAETPLN